RHRPRHPAGYEELVWHRWANRPRPRQVLFACRLVERARLARKDGRSRFALVRTSPLTANAALDHEIDRAARHDEVLYIVAPDENKAAAAIDVGLLAHAQALLRLWTEQTAPDRRT